MSQVDHDILNPTVNLEARLATFQFVDIRRKTHTVDGQTVAQVGLFARTDLGHPIPEGLVILEEKPLVWYQEPPETEEDDIDSFRETIGSLTPQEKNIYNILYCSPELLRSNDQEGIDLGRWWTNRFLFQEESVSTFANNPSIGKKRRNTIEAIYQHSSAINHSCLNPSAETRLKPNDADLTLQVVAKQEIKPGEEILIHYDWAEFHDLRSGRRNKKAHTVHSDLWINRGFSCEDCILEGSKRVFRYSHQDSEADLDAITRCVLQPASPMAVLKRRELWRKESADRPGMKLE
ncbi:hypothetical protein BGX38DRAFT_1275453 [Terfezia claveryi]|nr:hypothetical protein BGX38DRAFT_1275453 [Terfezia claveryi]